MVIKDVQDQLESIASSETFAAASGELTEAWSAAKLEIDCVETILRFMEKHPAIDYGTPGPLVHFVEEFYLNGYEQKLVESVSRRPTKVTVWMLNRLINGTKDAATKEALITTMRETSRNLHADPQTIERVTSFLDRLKAAGYQIGN